MAVRANIPEQNSRRGFLPKLSDRISEFWAKYGIGYLFLAPFIILFTIFIIVPVFTAFGLSFTYYNMIQPAKWTGLTNYRVLFMDDDVFLIGLKNTLIFALITGPMGYIMSFMAAWVIDQLKFRNAFALAFYAPSITSGIAMSVVWMYFFSGDRYGLVNNLLTNIGLISEPILWNIDPKTILPVIIIVSVWMSMGTGFLVFLAGFQNIPKEMYEAGAIDGVKNKFQELWFITVPLMKPQLLFGAVNSIVGSFGVFDVAVSIAGMPSPNYAGHTIVAHLYDYAFIRFEMGYASAVAVILFAMTFILGRLAMKIFSSKDI
ncbi:carbohydrate ABC transporter permease [Mahella australiensis]|uniref:Carbohydrate ABC transporter membrane protein 1, CUT1 family n=1 Tax=Mahella australiensis (strain DSM 15567 / CIP 107919 / 50-1 BON) TaxID=697281 RepID=F4A330_MAHA5|nr:sugar ABC transporter permease [Mahella australiensis]AEE95245.1 carbohydrate ABC transporter membrane protein 1, CUT1 family [Mahella australiensis 50-1 BON]